MESIVELKGKVRKSFTPEQYKSRPWFTEEVTRRLYVYLTWLFIRFRVSANQVSLSVGILGIISGVAFIWGHFLIGVLLLQIWYLLDAVDGEVARYHGVDDLTGDYTDKLMHYVIEGGIFYAIGCGLAKAYDSSWIRYLGLWVAFTFTLLKLIYDLRYKCFVMRAQTSLQEMTFRKKEITEGSHCENFWRQKILKTYSLYPNVMNIITGVVLVDSFWKGFQWQGRSWSLLVILLHSYAIFYLIACVKSVYTIIQKKTIDREYQETLVFKDTHI
jgi:phosphatidylglycerophosphate synthase